MVWEKGKKMPSFKIDNNVYCVENTKGVLSSSLEMIVSSLFIDKVFPGTSLLPS